MSTLSIPERVGPGWWVNDHITCQNITSKQAEDEFIKAFELRISNFPCSSCRKHAISYLLAHDINEYRDMIDEETGKRVGMALYVWEMHNHVNKRNEKRELLLEEVPEALSRLSADKIGPGWWISDHITSANLDSQAAEDEFIRNFQYRIRHFPCPPCRQDATAYIESHDINRYRNMTDSRTGKRVGMFRYVFEMHNWVNKKLGHEELEYKSAYDMYRDAEACTSCGKK